MKTRSPKSAWAIPSSSCWPSGLRATSGSPLAPSSLATGWRGRSILFRVRTSTMPRSAFPSDWHHLYTGFRAHWNKNSNLGQAFDLWFLNLFPRAHTLRLQRWRLPDSEFHPHAGHHDPRPVRGTMVCGFGAQAADPQVRHRRRHSARGRRFSSLHRNLPHRQAHLDAKLDPLQWRHMLPRLSRVQLGHRCRSSGAAGPFPSSW